MAQQAPRFNYLLFGWIGPDGELVPDPSFRPGLPPPEYLDAWNQWQDGDGALWRLRFHAGRYEAATYTAPNNYHPIDMNPATSCWLVDLLRPYNRSWAQVARESERLAALKTPEV